MVADIEGAEKFFLLGDTSGLDGCEGMIIELHELDFEEKKYSVEDLKDTIVNLGFNIEYDEGPVVFAKRKK
ncbi:MAG: hypothetical protein COA58_01560 [Bacteroidetes bacterium]|nr:MAG: hypothetical protein COA58_01560 [Bacteroidota bacterium]